MRLACHGLSKSFGGIRALNGVHIEFTSSGLVAIIGPNGAGKTTLLNALTGFVRVDEGQCHIGEHETTYWPAHRIARLGVCRTFQHVRVARRLTVLENALLSRPDQRGERLLPALFRLGVRAEEGRNVDAAMACLELVGVAGLASEMAYSLSYGQQKLLSIACCVATEAKCLFLDEPISGLDPDMRDRICHLLKELGERERMIIFIEHDIAAVASIAERLVLMDNGRVVADGAPAAVLSQAEVLEAYLG